MNRYTIVLGGLVLALLLTFGASNALAGTVTVYDSHGTPIQGVLVQWSTNSFSTYSSGTTDASGVVTTAPTSGTYSFRALYHNTSSTQTNKDIGTLDVTFYTSEMQAQVYKHDGTTPFQGVPIKFSPSGGFGVYVSDNTDAGGLAKTELFPGTIYVRASVSGTSADQNIGLAGDGTTSGQSSLLTFYTSESKAEVEDCGGSPKIEGARIQFFYDGTHGTYVSVNTDANGIASTELFPGTHDMQASISNTAEIKTYTLAGNGMTSGQSTTTTFTPTKVDITYNGTKQYWIGTYPSGYWSSSFTGVIYMFPATVRFRFGVSGGFESDVTISGCSVAERLVTIKLIDSYGNGLAGGEAKYNLSGWQTAGTTNSNGEAFALIDGSQSTLAFQMYWEDTYIQKNQNVATDPVVIFSTVLVQMELHSSAGAQLTGEGQVNSGSWKALGNTPTAGMELLPTTYAFRIYYEDTYIQKNQNVATDPVVIFSTVLVKMELHSSTGAQLTGEGRVNSGTWKTVGNTPTAGMELLPTTYAFRVYYEDTYIQKNQDVASDQLVVFTTVLVQMELHSSTGAQLTGEGQVNSGTWKSMGTTPTATHDGGKELLPKTYAFRVYYEDSYIQKNQDVSSDHLVVFETVLVTPPPTPACSAPNVTGNPQDQTVCAGSGVSFSANAEGDPSPTIKWQVSTDGQNFTSISGATSATLTFATSSPDNGKKYQAVFSNDCGSETTTAATLTVNTPTVVTTNPADQTVLAGCSATFSSAASGSPTPTVQWQVSADGGTSWSNISGATNITLTLSSVTTSQSGKKYHAVFTNSCNVATTNAAMLTVQPSATLKVQFIVYEVLDNRCRPKIRCVPVEGAEVRVYTLKEVCANDLVITGQPKIWGKIYDGLDGPGGDDPGCPILTVGSYVAKGVTNANGQVSIIVPPTTTKPDIDYVVIGSTLSFDDVKTADDPDALYSGVRIASIRAGNQKVVALRRLRLFSGKIVPATALEETGTYLAIVEPEYMDWDSDQEQYPFVMESDGDWSVATTVEPPEGFVSDYSSLSTEVEDTTTAIQFTLTDVGSKWTSTSVKHQIRHKGKIKVRASGVPMFDRKKNKIEEKAKDKIKGKSTNSAASGSIQALTQGAIPTEYALYQNYPDPFNPSTTLQFDLPEPAVVSMRVYNTLGQEVVSLLDHMPYEPGKHAIKFDASRLSSGVYIYQLIAGRFVDTKKMLLLK